MTNLLETVDLSPETGFLDTLLMGIRLGKASPAQPQTVSILPRGTVVWSPCQNGDAPA